MQHIIIITYIYISSYIIYLRYSITLLSSDNEGNKSTKFHISHFSLARILYTVRRTEEPENKKNEMLLMIIKITPKRETRTWNVTGCGWLHGHTIALLLATQVEQV